MTNRSRFAIALAALAGGIVSAQADVIVTLTQDDLAGSYTQTAPGVGNFSAVAVNFGPGSLQSAAQVSRDDSNPGSASFEVGYATGGSSAAFSINLSVVVLIPNLLASGMGTFTATDADGDTVSGNIDGNWVYDSVQGFTYFNGSLSNVLITDNGAQDGLFNGTVLGSSWSLNGLGTQPFDGALTQLFLGTGFFAGNFSNVATGLTAQIIPAPGALALLGLGGVVAGRRRR